LVHGMFNAYWEPLSFELPPIPGESEGRWRRMIDTALASPDDLRPWPEAPPVEQAAYVAQPRSLVVLALPLQRGSRM
ncbi:MAG TPA: glycogen debranching enzyme, partial [Vicinamibacteria bacterium]